MAFYLSFMVNGALAGLLLARGTYDLLYATSPPLFVGAAALALSVIRRIPLVFEVRDLWPESAITLGQLSNERLVRLATRLEETCYRRARLIVVTAQEILDRLVQREQPSEKLALVRNGANVDLFKRDEPARERVRAALALENRFVVLYAGLFGLAYDLELVLETARDLQTRAPDVQFLLVGEGPTKRRIQERASSLNLKNVTFLPSVPRECIPSYFSAADISLVPIREPNIRGMVPVKIYDSMACEVPLVIGSTGEAGSIVEKAGSGLTIRPGDPDQLRDAVLHMRSSLELRRRCGHNGRRAVVAHFSRQAQAQRLVRLLEAL
jgi:glycosyltransferase involved in cell wall biosynthesis